MTTATPQSFHVAPVTLETDLVRLEPLTEAHTEAFFHASNDPSIWRFLPYVRPATAEAMRDTIIATAFKRRDAGIEQPFVIIERATGELVGSTRYLDIQPHHRNLEIGWTWLTPSRQRTPINTHAKFLLLRHAFEDLGAIRVCLKTDSRNEPSQRAIERIGAKREGVLRNHYIMPDGHYRDSVYFSIIHTEWPSVKERLQSLMNL